MTDGQDNSQLLAEARQHYSAMRRAESQVQRITEYRQRGARLTPGMKSDLERHRASFARHQQSLEAILQGTSS